ncbi:MAG: hypothetical protein ACK5LS_07130 [Propioniciclava sp.]
MTEEHEESLAAPESTSVPAPLIEEFDPDAGFRDPAHEARGGDRAVPVDPELDLAVVWPRSAAAPPAAPADARDAGAMPYLQESYRTLTDPSDTEDQPITELTPVTDLDATSGAFHGPMRILTLAVAAGWVLLAVFCLWQLSPPWSFVLGAVGVVAAAGTAALGLSMGVKWNAEGIFLPGRGHMPWAEIDQISVQPGRLTVPQVEVRVGRAIETIPLDGLAWFGSGARVVTVAQQIADRGGLGEVRTVERVTAPGRRGTA